MKLCQSLRFSFSIGCWNSEDAALDCEEPSVQNVRLGFRV